MRPTTTATAASCSTCCARSSEHRREEARRAPDPARRIRAAGRLGASRRRHAKGAGCRCSSSIIGPRDLDALTPEQLEQLAAGDPRLPHRERVAHRRSPRPEPRRRRADDRDAPRLRLAERPDRLRHRAPVATCTSCSPAGRTSAACARAAASPATRSAPRAAHDVVESSHASSSLSWADGISRALTRTGRKRPARRRGRRRRRAHRRHDVGGAQQHLRRQRPQPRHRRQRQRPLVRADDRRHGALPQPRAHRRRATANLRRGSDALFGKLGPAGARVLPRRPRRHARLPRRASPTTRRCTRTSTSSTSARSTATTCRRSIETLRAGQGRTARPVIVHAITEKGRGYEPARDDEADQFHAVGQIDPETGRAARQLAGARRGRTSSPTSSSRSASDRDDVIGDHGGDAAPDRAAAVRGALPRPRATTSASPSSTPWPPPPASPSAACTPSSRSTRRS